MDHMVDFVLRNGVVADESNHSNLTVRRDLANALDSIRRRTERESNNTLEPIDIQYQCQIHHLDLQFGFVKAWLCRPALRHLADADTNTPDASLRRELYKMCLQSSRDCLFAFIQLNTLCVYPFRSWSVIHNGLSSLLLLALTGELRRDSHLHATLGELLDMFESNQVISGGDHRATDHGTWLSPAYTRAVKALRQMFLRDSGTTTNEHDLSTASYELSQDVANPAIPMYIHFTLLTVVNLANAFTRRQTRICAPNERPPSIMDLQDFDFLNDLPPLDAFDSILWYVTLYSIKRIPILADISLLPRVRRSNI